ncbi:MAG TPA: electron transfer flavoprotein subunit beta/FixA family protein [Clostridia bacterium]|jgi:electron transfer flavoprotein beta subunit|nr:electron transfer flavoprotein subunit beta/FixA family protein [Clostridia bacterium]HQO56229.1 electron transfer flavoprotein subunit beta/FixA family protein [Clostridia bacterium]
MNILCLVKQVPDSLEVHLGSDLTLQRDFIAQVLNHADESAVELALRLRDSHGGRVTAMTMGPKSAEGMLRELISCGVDEAVLLTDRAFAGADTLATARALTAAAKTLGPFDLLLFGRRAADGETGQVGAMTAALMEIPCVANVTSVEFENNTLRAHQLIETGTVHWEVKLPAALTLCEWSYALRLPTMRGLRTAKQTDIRTMKPADIGITDPLQIGLKGSPTRVTHVSVRPSGVRPTKWIDAGEAVLIAREICT